VSGGKAMGDRRRKCRGFRMLIGWMLRRNWASRTNETATEPESDAACRCLGQEVGFSSASSEVGLLFRIPFPNSPMEFVLNCPAPDCVTVNLKRIPSRNSRINSFIRASRLP
jgi:hypothetical protein